MLFSVSFKRWSPEEATEVTSLFQDFIVRSCLPPKKTIESRVIQSAYLKGRNWRMIREHLRFHHVRK